MSEPHPSETQVCECGRTLTIKSSQQGGGSCYFRLLCQCGKEYSYDTYRFKLEPLRKALVTGISGQTGSYLAELLLEKGYEVHGISRRVAVDSAHRFERIEHILPRLHMHSAAVENYGSLFNVINEVKPDMFFHLAAQSFVMDSFQDGFTTMRDNVDGTHNVLEILKRYLPECRFYFAGSSEMFGAVLETPQTERTPFNPRSIYGISKCTGFYMTKHYRDAYGLHASSGICFNHESPRRGTEFVTRKIARTAARIAFNKESVLMLGNLDACRDWGHAKDTARAMWLMLQQEQPDDYVIATGETRSVRAFCELAFNTVGMNYEKRVKIDQQFVRPSEVDLLIGDSSKARRCLGWKPEVTFEELVREMVQAEVEIAKRP